MRLNPTFSTRHATLMVALLAIFAVPYACGGPGESKVDLPDQGEGGEGGEGGAAGRGGTSGDKGGGKGGGSGGGAAGTAGSGGGSAGSAGTSPDAGATDAGGDAAVGDAAIDAAVAMGGMGGTQTGGVGGMAGMGGVMASGGMAGAGSGGAAPTGLVAYFKLDDASGVAASAAADASPTGLAGRYIGTTTAATTVMGPAAIKFPNPGAARFVATSVQAVVAQNVPQALRPVENLSLAAWFKTASMSVQEVVGMGDSYVLRVQPGAVNFVKRVTGDAWYECSAAATTASDNTWHHLAAVQDATTITVYLDGVALKTCTEGSDIVYDQGMDLVIGGHGRTPDRHMFDGDLDDVRIYNVALTAAQVASLAAGNP